MCECCGNKAENNQAHVHVDGVNCNGCFGKIKTAMEDTPGVLSVEFKEEKKQARIVYDQRILPLDSLKQSLSEIGYNI